MASALIDRGRGDLCHDRNAARHLVAGMQAYALKLARSGGGKGKDLSDPRFALLLDKNVQVAWGDLGQFHLDRAGQEGPDQETGGKQ